MMPTGDVITTGITYETTYVNGHQNITLMREGKEIGAIQERSVGHWLPRRGIGIQSLMPIISWKLEDPHKAILWILSDEPGY